MQTVAIATANLNDWFCKHNHEHDAAGNTWVMIAQNVSLLITLRPSPSLLSKWMLLHSHQKSNSNTLCYCDTVCDLECSLCLVKVYMVEMVSSKIVSSHIPNQIHECQNTCRVVTMMESCDPFPIVPRKFPIESACQKHNAFPPLSRYYHIFTDVLDHRVYKMLHPSMEFSLPQSSSCHA